MVLSGGFIINESDIARLTFPRAGIFMTLFGGSVCMMAYGQTEVVADDCNNANACP